MFCFTKPAFILAASTLFLSTVVECRIFTVDTTTSSYSSTWAFYDPSASTPTIFYGTGNSPTIPTPVANGKRNTDVNYRLFYILESERGYEFCDDILSGENAYYWFPPEIVDTAVYEEIMFTRTRTRKVPAGITTETVPGFRSRVSTVTQTATVQTTQTSVLTLPAVS